jgi:LysR family transcriptional regulator, chromosome initiation inhibitor
MNGLDLSQLRALAAVATEGTFEAAARALNLTPSAISQRIKALELQTGRVLLVRSKPAQPTEAGTTLLRLMRQFELLAQEVTNELAPDTSRVDLPIAVNADSLNTWLLPALAPLAGQMSFDLYRADQAYTTALLRAGTVVAAITGDPKPPPGCRSAFLGKMIYRPMANGEFRQHWFEDGVTAKTITQAPMVVFDRDDELQHRYLRSKTRRPVTPPTHYVPASADFVRAIELGFGWGMVPDSQATDELTAIDTSTIAVPLYWQQWKLSTTGLDQVADAVQAAAKRVLA